MTTNVVAAATGLSPYAIDDLVASGLVPSDIAARLLTAIEFTATGPPTSVAPDGYVIPYFDISGDPVQFYRVKVLDTMGGPKYRSMKNQPNHIYYPPGWAKLMKQAHKYVIITEGEKKAAAAVKSGFPCVALSGVDNWRNRHIRMPASTELKTLKKDGPIIAKIPAGDSNALVVQDSGVVAVGFHDLVDYVVQKEMEIIIIFDTDKGGLKTQVQRAAAALGYELRYRGLAIASIRQLILPPSKKGDKIGLDDYLMRKGTKEFASILRACRQKRIAFPRHPNPKTYVASRLQKARLSRKEVQDVALSILMELETRGRRLRNVATQNMFFFNEKTHTLLDVHLNSQRVMLHDTAFGAYLYREFNLSATDTRVVGWLAAQFHGEPGAEDARTQRVFAKPDDMKDCMAFQLSDSHYVIITPNPDKPYIICENGTHGVLFEQGHVAPIPHIAMELALEEAMESNDTLWKDVLGDFNFVPLNPSAGTGDLSEEQLLKEGRHLAILLYYISPWLLRWKGLQLPVELVIGEPGSGKSSLYELRQTIVTGYPRLSNMTNDIKDWYAGITGRGGLYVMDNVHFTGSTKDYQQRLSDELAQPLTALVLTPTGYRTMGEITIGDTILDPWGRHVKIIKEHPQGLKEVYRITLSDGTSVESTADHRWYVRTRDDLGYADHTHGQILDATQMMSQGLRYGGKNKRAKWAIPGLYNHKIDLTRADLNYDEHEHLSPYVLGAFLGDGHLASKQLFLAGVDNDIIDRVRDELPDGITLGSSQPGNYYIRGDTELKEAFRTLGLGGTHARTKFIPLNYIYTTCANRLALLRGLMDTDGTVNQNGTGYFSSMSQALADGVNFIVGSLGGRSTINQRSDGAYQVSVILPMGMSPFHCTTKHHKYMSRKHMSNYRSIMDIEYIGMSEVKCISLESPEGMYITDNFTLTHNCRLVTDPDPHIEQRKYYTNADIISLPVSVTFALTSIEQPFFTLDLIQRAAIFELHVIQTGHDANWVQHQMAKGNGRIGWAAHHLAVIHKFLHRAVHQGKWDSKYRATHRLAHYEQALMMMADTLGMPSDWIPAALQRQTATKMSEADWTMSGLAEFVVHFKRTYGESYEGKRFDTRDIVEWAEAHDTYHKNAQLTNGWRLGKYLRSHRGTMQKTTGAFENGKQGNRIMYSIT